MANRFWVGGTATWDTTAGTKWATASGGGGGSAVPNANDNVFFDAASGAVTVTTQAGTQVHSGNLNFTGFTGTFVMAGPIEIGGSATFVSGMTFTGGTTYLISFTATSSGKTLTTGGKTLDNLSFEGVGGVWTLQDNLTVGGGFGLVYLQAGTLDLNSKTIVAKYFSDAGSTSTKVLTLGASTITLSDTSTPWDFSSTGYTLNPGNSAITFSATSGTATIKTGGQPFNLIAFNGSGGTFSLLDDVTCNNRLTINNGILTTNNHNITTPEFASNNAVITLNLGSSLITVNGANGWHMDGATGSVVINPGTSIINLTSNTGPAFSGGAKTYNEVRFTGNGTAAITGENTFATLLRTNSSGFISELTIGANQTITSSLTITGVSNSSRIFLRGQTLGIPFNIICNGSISLTNVDFRDIGARSSSFWTGTSLGDAQGNSGITFDAPKNIYWIGNTGNWSSSSAWSSTSSGASTTNEIPLPQDTAIFDINSFTSGGRVVTVDYYLLCKNLLTTGVINSPNFNFTSTNSEIFGNINFSPTVGSVTGTVGNIFTMRGRLGVCTITSSGLSLGCRLVINGPSTGSTLVKLLDSLTVSYSNSIGFSISNGGFDANNFNVTCPAIAISSTGNPVFMGSGTWTASGTGTVFQVSSGILYCQTSTIVISDSSASSKTFAGNGKVFNNLTISGGGAGAIIITGANTFNVFTVTGPKTITFTISITQTIASLILVGDFGNLITLTSTINATKFSLIVTSATAQWVSVKDSTVTGTASPIPIAGGTDGGNNTALSWIFDTGISVNETPTITENITKTLEDNINPNSKGVIVI